MEIKKVTIFLFGFILFSLLVQQPLFSQDMPQCSVIKKYPHGGYLVQIGDKTYLAITESIEKEMLKMKRDLLDYRREIVLKDSLLATYDETIAWYDTTMKNMKSYIRELEEVLNGYKGLLHDYKKLKEPWFTFKAGIGATGEDYKPAVLMGLGIRKFSIWGILQERNAGLIVGKQFPIY